MGAVRETLRALSAGRVVGIFPEGGIDEHRDEEGHRGVGYLAVKSGATVVPASITWDRPRPLNLLHALLKPGTAVVRYGTALPLAAQSTLSDETIRAATRTIMHAIRNLRAAPLSGQS